MDITAIMSLRGTDPGVTKLKREIIRSSDTKNVIVMYITERNILRFVKIQKKFFVKYILKFLLKYKSSIYIFQIFKNFKRSFIIPQFSELIKKC